MSGNANKSTAGGSQLQTTQRLKGPHASHRQCSISRTPNKSDTTTRLSWTRKHRVLTANLPTCIHTGNAPNVCVETATQSMRSKREGQPRLSLSRGVDFTLRNDACDFPKTSQHNGWRTGRADQKSMRAPTQRLTTKCTDKWTGATDEDSL